MELATEEGEKGKFSITVKDGSISGKITTNQKFTLSCNQCNIDQIDDQNNVATHTIRITYDDQIIFNDLNKYMVLIVEFKTKSSNKNPLFQDGNILVDELKFITNIKGSEESTIIDDGQIAFSELDGELFKVKAGDLISITGLESFQIKRLTLTEHLALNLKGRLRGIKTGTQGFYYPRMPTYLQYLRTNGPIKLYIGALIPIFIIIMASLARLRIGKTLSYGE